MVSGGQVASFKDPEGNQFEVVELTHEFDDDERDKES